MLGKSYIYFITCVLFIVLLLQGAWWKAKILDFGMSENLVQLLLSEPLVLKGRKRTKIPLLQGWSEELNTFACPVQCMAYRNIQEILVPFPSCLRVLRQCARHCAKR